MTNVADLPQPRPLAPFSYFPGQTSALAGLGGQRQAPDPRYCFHTLYEEHRPGIVMFTVRLIGARASFGEMTVRIHAYRPNSNLDIALVTATQHLLENMNGEDVEIVLRIAAIPGVQYAAYGFLSEPSDLEVIGLQVAAEDLGGAQDDSFAAAELGETGFGNKPLDRLRQLVGEHPPEFHKLLSQPFTAGQLRSNAFAETIARLPTGLNAELELWRYAFALRVLSTYGFLEPGARGLLLGPAAPIIPALLASGTQLVQHGAAPDDAKEGLAPTLDRLNIPLAELPSSIVHCDFALAFGVLDGAPSYAQMLERLNCVLKCLLRGGIGIFLFDFWPNSWGAPSNKTFIPTETSITRLALHVIGHGSGIAQLLLPSVPSVEARGVSGVPFGLIVRR